MIEIITRVKNGLPVMARGTLASAEPDVGIPTDYCDEYDLFWLTGSPFRLPISADDDQRICEEILERATRARELYAGRHATR